jgi:large conductance mechanosensitive channel
MHGFLQFIREQGVIGLAVGFILGGAVSKVVTSLVSDIVNPLLGFALGAAGDLKSASFAIGSANILWGNFINTSIDFLIVALVVYYGVKILKVTNADKKV